MLAYKFRPPENAAFIFHILINKRLFCASWQSLNDPMEGFFKWRYPRQEPEALKIVKGIKGRKKKYRVCSLCQTFDSHLLWAHYANGFTGAAIEVNLPDDISDIKKVNYGDMYPLFELDETTDTDRTARDILFSKYEEWRHEQEVRIICNNEHFSLREGVSRVIVGHRMHTALQNSLEIICDREGIDFQVLEIAKTGLQ